MHKCKLSKVPSLVSLHKSRVKLWLGYKRIFKGHGFESHRGQIYADMIEFPVLLGCHLFQLLELLISCGFLTLTTLVDIDWHVAR